MEQNPVRARLIKNPQSWRGSSARAHLTGVDDRLVKVAPLLELVGDWKYFLRAGTADEMAQIRKHERTGRPLGKETFVCKLEGLLEKTLKSQKPGPKAKREIDN